MVTGSSVRLVMNELHVVSMGSARGVCRHFGASRASLVRSACGNGSRGRCRPDKRVHSEVENSAGSWSSNGRMRQIVEELSHLEEEDVRQAVVLVVASPKTNRTRFACKHVKAQSAGPALESVTLWSSESRLSLRSTRPAGLRP